MRHYEHLNPDIELEISPDPYIVNTDPKPCLQDDSESGYEKEFSRL